jgi:hypothetical protein
VTIVGSFDVLKRLADMGDNDLRLAPMSEVISARKVKLGTQVTIGVGGDIVGSLAAGELVGGFLFCSKKRFEEVRAQLIAEAERDRA